MSPKKKFMLGLVLCCIVIYVLFFKKEYINQEYLMGAIEPFGMYAPIIFTLLFYILAMVFTPVTFLAVLTGILFGTFKGIIIAIVAATAAGVTGFLFARRFGANFSEQLANHSYTGKWMGKVEKSAKHNGLWTFLLLRGLFLPYMPASYAAGFVRTAQLWHFFIATLISNCVFLSVLVYFGDNVLKGMHSLLIPTICLILVLQIPLFMRRRDAEQK